MVEINKKVFCLYLTFKGQFPVSGIFRAGGNSFVCERKCRVIFARNFANEAGLLDSAVIANVLAVPLYPAVNLLRKMPVLRLRSHDAGTF